MRPAKLLLTTVLGSVLVASFVGCTAKAADTTETQVVTVERGDLSVTITGTGNLAFSKTDDLTFDMAGTVDQVLVEEGEIITEGQVLAKLDTTAWDEQVETLEKALTIAERNLKTADRQITGKELAVNQASLDLKTAEQAVLDIPAVKAAQDLVDNAELALNTARNMYGINPTVTSQQMDLITQQLAQARQNLKEVLAGTSFSVTGDIALQISKTLLNVEQANRKLGDAQIAVDDAIIARDDSRKALEKANDALDEAKALSPEIKASFAGFVTKVNVEGGDEVNKGLVAIQIADPTKFEANILVSENDIFQVQLEGDATVAVDAMSGLSLPAKVTYVAPTASVQQGVVNYKVMVELQSIDALSQQRQQARLEGGQAPTPEQLAERLKEAVAQGRMTQEQADAILKQMNEGGAGVFQQGVQPGAFGQQNPFLQRGTLSQSPQANTGNATRPQLKQGLSVTVDIVTAERTNVLLVPNDAVVRKAGGTVVSVQNNGTTEQRQVTCGISDWQNTEVLDGLKEGDQVVITKSTSSSGTSQQNRNGAFFGAPGVRQQVVGPR